MYLCVSVCVCGGVKVCPSVRLYTKETLYKVLMKLMDDEEEVTSEIHMSQSEVRMFRCLANICP